MGRTLPEVGNSREGLNIGEIWPMCQGNEPIRVWNLCPGASETKVDDVPVGSQIDRLQSDLQQVFSKNYKIVIDFKWRLN